MKVLQINVLFNRGSTGKIVFGIHELCLKYKIVSKAAHRYDTENEKSDDVLNVTSWFDCHVHNRLARILMLQGCFSTINTYLFLKKVKKFNPDIIHLHNIHSNYINLRLLFNFIKKNNIFTVWTLHDCWAFTGYCPHFTMIKCNKWQNECNHCPSRLKKTALSFDNSKLMYRLKKKWFTGVDNMTIVTPSMWLADLVSQSFLKDYPVKVINNGINLELFKPIETDLREKYNLVNKHVLLGVAFGWGKAKGLDVFIELSKRLEDDYKIILVGTTEKIDAALPENILSINRTSNQSELSEIYTAADLFVNPTREENFPTVNIEALACGTPVLTFNTGGSGEILDNTCGSIVDCDDIDALENEIRRICTHKPYSAQACLDRAKSFDMNDRFKEYIHLYENCSHSAERTV